MKVVNCGVHNPACSRGNPNILADVAGVRSNIQTSARIFAMSDRTWPLVARMLTMCDATYAFVSRMLPAHGVKSKLPCDNRRRTIEHRNMLEENRSVRSNMPHVLAHNRDMQREIRTSSRKSQLLRGSPNILRNTYGSVIAPVVVYPE